MQSNHEVDDEGKDHDREERYWHIHDCESGRFDEWMVHGGFGMFHHNGSLREESRDFGHGGQCSPKQGTGEADILDEQYGRRCGIYVDIQENNTSAREVLRRLVLQPEED